MIGIRYEGLRELAQALRTVNHELYDALISGLASAGKIVRADAAEKFEAWGGDRPGIEKAAGGFRAFVRPNTSTMAILSVGQSLRRSEDLARRRSNLGDLFMRKALLPARNEKLVDVAVAIDESVAQLLHEHGF